MKYTRHARLPVRGALALALLSPMAAQALPPALVSPALHHFIARRLTTPPVTAPIADAAMQGDVATVRALLAKGADVSAAQPDGMTALHWAAQRGDSALAALLLRAKASVSGATRIGGYQPLHVAAEAGSAAVVKQLLAARADARALTTEGVTPLHLAALAGVPASITALLRAGADVNALEPGWNQSPLMVAAGKGRADAVRVLLTAGANHALVARTMDIMASAAQDRQAKNRRDALLQELREKQGQANNPNWMPSPAQVQEAVKASREVERAAASAEGIAGVRAATAAEEARLAAQGGRGLDDDNPAYNELLGVQGGLTALLLAVREGEIETTEALLDGGANIDQVSGGDHTSPLLMATINGHYDLALRLVKRGANPNLASDAGAAPLFAVLNKEWAPSTRTPQPAFQLQQQATYLEVMQALIAAKANPNARLTRSLWYTTYNRDNLGVDFNGATPFLRAAYATDTSAMRLLLKAGADPGVGTIKPPPRARRPGAAAPVADPSGLPPVPVGGLGILPLHAAAGVGYGTGFAGNDHRHVNDGWLPTVKMLVEELGADVNARDFAGYTPLHHAAARGDNAMIKYLVSKGADPTLVARSGQTTVDMANGPIQRTSPYPDTIALLESLGAKNNHKCVSC